MGRSIFRNTVKCVTTRFGTSIKILVSNCSKKGSLNCTKNGPVKTKFFMPLSPHFSTHAICNSDP